MSTTHKPARLRFEMLLGLGLRGVSAVASFAITWTIARIFGAEAVGLYQTGFVTANFVSLMVSLGLDILLVREASRMVREDRMGDARATYQAILAIMLRSGVLVIAGLALLAWPLTHLVLGEPAALPFLLVMAPVVLLLPLLKLSTALLRILGRVTLSQSLEGVSYSSIALVGLATAWLLGWTHWNLLPAVLYPAAMALSVAAALYLAGRAIRAWPIGAAQVRAHSAWPIITAPLASQGGNWIILMLVTTIAGIGATGVYQTAVQIGMMFQLVNASFAMMVGPHLAREASAGNGAAVRSILRNAGLMGLGLCLPLTVLGLIVPGWIMGLFGDQFRNGALALQILVTAQTINVGFGPVGTALIMMRREKLVLKMEMFASVSGLLVAFAAIGSYGIAGAASGVLVASAIRNFGNYISVRIALRQLPQPQ